MFLLSGLDYFPGVHSRRWSGASEDDKGRNEKILELMKNIRHREAYLISRFSLCNSNKELKKYSVENFFRVTTEIKGTNGFGYDSILTPSEAMLSIARIYKRITPEREKFILENSITIGEMTQEEKNAINYRGVIAKRIAEFLKGEMNG